MVDMISFKDWEKMDLRVGKVTSVEEIPGADKLYKVEVDLGKEFGKRTLVAGIKENYKKEDIKGKQIIVLTNLEPRVMKGTKSEGMLLAAVSDDHKKVFLLQPDKNIDLGSKVS